MLKTKILLLLGGLCVLLSFGAQAGGEDSLHFTLPQTEAALVVLLDSIEQNMGSSITFFEQELTQLHNSAALEDFSHGDKTLFLLGVARFYSGQMQIADSTFRAVIDQYDISSLYARRARYCLGNVKVWEQKYYEAIIEYTNAIPLFQKEEDLPYLLTVLGNIGVNYRVLGELDSAMVYVKMGMDLATEVKDEIFFREIQNRLWHNKGEAHKAIQGWENLLPYYRKKTMLREIIDAYSTLATLHLELDEVAIAEMHCDSAAQYIEPVATDQLSGHLCTIFGRLNIAKKDFETAKGYCLQAAEFGKANGISAMEAGACDCLLTCYKALGETQNELLVSRRVLQDLNPLLISENNKVASKKLFSMAMQQKDKVIALQEESQKTEQRRRKITRYLIALGLVVVIFIIVIVTRSSLALQRSKKLQVEIVKELKAQGKELKAQQLEAQIEKENADEASAKLKVRNQEIIYSLTYASKVQRATMVQEEYFRSHFKESFVLYKPKDIVSGDIYWCEKIEETLYFAVIDCTGHGAPGAMMSILLQNQLQGLIREHTAKTPGQILDMLNKSIVKTMNTGAYAMKDGADMALCKYDTKNSVFEFSGAMLSLYVKKPDELIEVKATRKSVGSVLPEIDFKTENILLSGSDVVYIFTDGFADQFGMRTGKKLKKRPLLNMLEEIGNDPLDKQGEMLHDYFLNWKGSQEQTDDVTMVGLRY